MDILFNVFSKFLIFKKIIFIIALMFFQLSNVAYGQSFSCPFLKEPACLDRNSKVVDKDAQCFSSYQCIYGGFMCTEDCNDKIKNIGNSYDDLVDKYNDLVNKNNELTYCLNMARDLNDFERCRLLY